MPLRPLIRSAASPRSGKFRRDWIAAELTEENATQKGLIYRSADDEIVYTVIDRVLDGELDALWKDLAAAPVAYWTVRRHSVVDGRFVLSSKDDLPSLADAISVASAEHEASIQRSGPVPEDEWPEDSEAHWTMAFSYFASPRRPGSRGG